MSDKDKIKGFATALTGCHTTKDVFDLLHTHMDKDTLTKELNKIDADQPNVDLFNALKSQQLTFFAVKGIDRDPNIPATEKMMTMAMGQYQIINKGNEELKKKGLVKSFKQGLSKSINNREVLALANSVKGFAR